MLVHYGGRVSAHQLIARRCACGITTCSTSARGREYTGAAWAADQRDYRPSAGGAVSAMKRVVEGLDEFCGQVGQPHRRGSGWPVRRGEASGGQRYTGCTAPTPADTPIIRHRRRGREGIDALGVVANNNSLNNAHPT